jgi:hypothetical protein
LWTDAPPGESLYADKFDWSRRSRGTPSWNTGPDRASDGKYYLFIETSWPRKTNDNAILFTAKPLKIGSGASLSFDYHMKGRNINTLQVKVKGSLYLAQGSKANGFDVVFKKTLAQGSDWKTADVDLAQYAGEDYVSIAFEASRGSSWSGDIAIDNVILSPGTTPPVSGPEDPVSGE